MEATCAKCGKVWTAKADDLLRTVEYMVDHQRKAAVVCEACYAKAVDNPGAHPPRWPL